MAEHSVEQTENATDPWGEGLSPEEQSMMAEQAEMENDDPEIEEPELEPEPEAEPEPEGEDEPEVRDEKTVPYNALHEERQRRKEIAEELAQQRERAAKMEDRLQQIMERFETANKPQEQDVSFDQDPAEYLRREAERTSQSVAEVREQLEQRQHQEARATEMNNFMSQYRQQAASYAEKDPQFHDAYQHLVQSRLQEYKEAGYSEQEALQALHRDEIDIANRAFRDGINPAERIVSIAKSRGFNGAKPVQKEDGADTIQRVSKGQKAAKSLKGRAEPNLSLESLAEMDDNDFDKYWDVIVGGGNKSPF